VSQHHGRTISPHDDAVCARTRATYAAATREWGDPGWEARRAAEIAALPTVEWRGRTLYTLRCHGTRGKGPHDVHLPERVLWSLIGLTHFRCVYHAGD
jgi:hypothetical protein